MPSSCLAAPLPGPAQALGSLPLPPGPFILLKQRSSAEYTLGLTGRFLLVCSPLRAWEEEDGASPETSVCHQPRRMLLVLDS